MDSISFFIILFIGKSGFKNEFKISIFRIVSNNLLYLSLFIKIISAKKLSIYFFMFIKIDKNKQVMHTTTACNKSFQARSLTIFHPKLNIGLIIQYAANRITSVCYKAEKCYKKYTTNISAQRL